MMGHAFNAFDNQPNVILSLDGRNPAATYNGMGTCANLYCHGNGQGDNGKYSDGGAPLTCVSCHGGNANSRAGMSGHHRSDHGNVACSECHNGTVATGNTVVTGIAQHVDGKQDVAFARGGTYDPATRTCSGIACHGTQRW